MRNSKPHQIVTLSVFILLLSGFVGYRSGVFDLFLSSSKNIQNSNLNAGIPLDTPTILVDSLKIDPALLPTSKSGVIFIERENKNGLNNNTTNTDQKIQDSIKESEKQKEINHQRIMSSSKSAIMFKPPLDTIQKYFLPKTDSFGVRTDTLEQKIEAP